MPEAKPPAESKRRPLSGWIVAAGAALLAVTTVVVVEITFSISFGACEDETADGRRASDAYCDLFRGEDRLPSAVAALILWGPLVLAAGVWLIATLRRSESWLWVGGAAVAIWLAAIGWPLLA